MTDTPTTGDLTGPEQLDAVELETLAAAISLAITTTRYIATVEDRGADAVFVTTLQRLEQKVGRMYQRAVRS